MKNKDQELLAEAYAKICKEKVDQNDDDKNDFEDVQIARMVASGMTKEEAIAKVKAKNKVIKEYDEDTSLDQWNQAQIDKQETSDTDMQAKNDIIRLYSTELQYDETITASMERQQIKKRLLKWANNE